MSDLLLNLLYIRTSGGDQRTGNLEPTELVYSSSRTYLQRIQDLVLGFGELDTYLCFLGTVTRVAQYMPTSHPVSFTNGVFNIFLFSYLIYLS